MLPPCHPAIILQPVGQSLYLELVVSDLRQIHTDVRSTVQRIAVQLHITSYVCYSESGIEGLVLQSFNHSTLREPGKLRFWPRAGPEKAAQAEQEPMGHQL